MKAALVILVVALLAGAVTITPSRKRSLSLTPVRQERISRQELQSVCPPAASIALLRQAPRHCLTSAILESTGKLQRTLKRLQRQFDQQRQYLK